MPSPLPALAAAVCLALAGSAGAQDFSLQRVASGLARPVYLTSAPGDLSRVFVLEQHTGAIRILRLSDGALLPLPFLDLAGLSVGNEQGLLGLAFHPDYASNGFFYVYFTDPTSRIVRYEVSANPNVADPGSATPVLSFAQPQSNHNGGWIGFGPDDDRLYVASGDGGGRDDDGTGHTPGSGNAQDLTANLLGKLLRLDVDGDGFPGDPGRNYAIPADNPFAGSGGDPEIWAYGLRNPWRPGFDRATGDLYIADVGQDFCEEINVQPAASAGGANYGWRLREGVIATPTGGVGGPRPAGAIDPIFNYRHPGQACSNPDAAGFSGHSVTGGVVYRGGIASLRGRYFFADYVTARIWSLVWDGSPPAQADGTNFSQLTDHTLSDPRFAPDQGSLDSIVSFGEDAAGNLYVLDLDGEIFRLPEPAPAATAAAGAALLVWLARRRRRAGAS